MTTKTKELQAENERLRNTIDALKSVLEGDKDECERLQNSLDRERGDYLHLVRLATEYLNQRDSYKRQLDSEFSVACNALAERDEARAWALWLARRYFFTLNYFVFRGTKNKVADLRDMFARWFGLRLPGPHLCNQDWHEVEE